MNPSETIRGVLFDKDGTLLDFDATWLPVYDQLSRHVAVLAGQPDIAQDLLVLAGRDPDSDRIDPRSPLACASLEEIWQLWAEHLDIEVDSPALTRMTFEYTTAHPTPLLPLAPLFQDLRALGLTLGVATMDATASARRTLEVLEVAHLIDFCTGYDGGHGTKPGPGMVRGFCARTGLRPEQVAVVGDTLHDMRMARAAGAALAIGVTTGKTDRTLLAAHADLVLDSLHELPAHLSP